MVKARESGSTFWGMIVFIVLTLVFVVMYYTEASDNDRLRDAARSAQLDAKTKDDRWTADNQVHLALGESVGYTSDGTGESKPDKAKIDAAIAEAKTSLPGLLSLPYDAEKYSATGEGGAIEVIGQGKKIITYMPKAEANGVSTLEGLIAQFPLAARRLAHDAARAFQQIDDLRAEIASLKTAQAQAIADLESNNASKDQQIAQNTATAQQAESDLRDQITGLQSQLESATAELEETRTRFEGQVSDLSNQVNQRKAEVVRLNDRARPFVTEGPDGAVLTAGHGVVVVDRGKADQLMPGTVFTVLGRRKGGARYTKGSIKVVSCDTDTASCRILSLDSARDPILGGDLIQSLTYSPNEKLSFAFLGEFKKMGRGDAMARMSALGADVHEAVQSDTHYLVVGTPGPGVDSLEDTDAYRRAKEYGVKIITESMLASFTRY